MKTELRLNYITKNDLRLNSDQLSIGKAFFI